MPCPICESSKALPGSLDVEKCAISCMMQESAGVDAVIQLLSPADFSSTECAFLFDAITRRHAAGDIIDPVSLGGYLADKGMLEKAGGFAFLSECYTASATPGHAKHYASAVLTASKRRQMARIASELALAAVADLPADSDDWRDAILPILRKADAVIMDGKGSELMTLKDVALRYAESGVEQNLDPPVPTGIKRLDVMLDGGIRREYVLIGGMQGHGKSLLAMQMAGALANAGRRGLVIGYDMSALQVLMRDLARETRIPLSHVMGRSPFEGQEITTLTRGITRLIEGWDVFYTESPYVTLESIAAHARTLNREKKLDFLVVDYIQTVPMKRVTKERSDETLIYISAYLEKLRKELECTLIAPVQLNSDGMTRGAGGLLDAPQVFIRIEMEKVENGDGEQESGDNGHLRFLKNRFGNSNRTCPVYRNGQFQAFEDRDATETPTPSRDKRPSKFQRKTWHDQ